ncbi:aminoglycoside phosphotransferase family protein [Anaeromicropila populeti]|uniref:Phosphotransferase enzyme family protein n=1 Tax=Anaeromicropila populeti TaxID=37658 RepID=A0A1I6ICX7_9FIRM|nr:aminoglycoside phosphotransferase family protein [Anaeromicropila populeti]SFR64474.1 Phosphotransferase enzyme family protein [Anaeromicropila populeti]
MLDLEWERSIPVIDVKLEELKNIFAEYDKEISIIGFSTIPLGCRNSNFVVNTNKGKYLLRLANISGINNEMLAYELVQDKINVPRLLYYITRNGVEIFIYQYISGVSMQKHIIEYNQCDRALLEQVARAAAIIHNTAKEKTKSLSEFDLPPFKMWYQYFLENPIVRTQLDTELCERIQRLVLDKQELITEIDKYQSFIHCDFRPANMLVDENKQVFFVDWEAACMGHSLADIGQFFRYRSFFKDTHYRLFEKVYNTFAIGKLPENWVELSLFRDLVNPLQLLSSNQEATYRNSDLINIIKRTLAYWDY